MLEIAAIAAGRCFAHQQQLQPDCSSENTLHPDRDLTNKDSLSPPNTRIPNGVVHPPPSLDFNAEMDRLHGIETESEPLESEVTVNDVIATDVLLKAPVAVTALDILRRFDSLNGTTRVSLNQLQMLAARYNSLFLRLKKLKGTGNKGDNSTLGIGQNFVFKLSYVA